MRKTIAFLLALFLTAFAIVMAQDTNQSEAPPPVPIVADVPTDEAAPADVGQTVTDAEAQAFTMVGQMLNSQESNSLSSLASERTWLDKLRNIAIGLLILLTVQALLHMPSFMFERRRNFRVLKT